jgi:RimJ/RimL family protein N-acetyltransferase
MAELCFPVPPLADDVMVGGVSLPEVRLDRGCAAVRYWLASGARGRGAATHAVGLLAQWAFAGLRLARPELTCGADREAPQPVAGRCGFSREGRFVLTRLDQRGPRSRGTW